MSRLRTALAQVATPSRYAELRYSDGRIIAQWWVADDGMVDVWLYGPDWHRRVDPYQPSAAVPTSLVVEAKMRRALNMPVETLAAMADVFERERLS